MYAAYSAAPSSSLVAATALALAQPALRDPVPVRLSLRCAAPSTPQSSSGCWPSPPGRYQRNPTAMIMLTDQAGLRISEHVPPPGYCNGGRRLSRTRSVDRGTPR
jgi:hypothetical protein